MEDRPVKVLIEREGSYSDGDKYILLTTHNGYQWSGGGLLTVEDLAILGDEIAAFLKDNKQ